MIQLNTILRKNMVFLKNLVSKITSGFRITPVYLGQFESENQNLWGFEFSMRSFYDIMRIYVLFLNSQIAKLANAYIFH